MKGKYITLQIRLACSKKPNEYKDLYKEMEKTIRDHRRVMRQFIKPATPYVRVNRQERELVIQ